MEHSSFREYLSRAAICRPLFGWYQVAAAKRHFNAGRLGLKLCTAIFRLENHLAAGTNMEAHARPKTPAFIVSRAPRSPHCRNSSHHPRRPQCRYQMVWRADSQSGTCDRYR
ncbi:hypothetical protein AGR8A_Cc40143 [Agrobacterium fabrum str. J-07]|nr:hypothetical protein AGR8A_Cc40143 [Agrobacterium fabrum str. J-07]